MALGKVLEGILKDFSDDYMAPTRSDLNHKRV